MLGFGFILIVEVRGLRRRVHIRLVIVIHSTILVIILFPVVNLFLALRLLLTSGLREQVWHFLIVLSTGVQREVIGFVAWLGAGLVGGSHSCPLVVHH